jgi:hypothetical protein
MKTKYLVYVKLTGNNAGSYIMRIDLNSDTVVSVVRDPTNSVKVGDKLANLISKENANASYYTKKEIIEMIFVWRGWKW